MPRPGYQSEKMSLEDYLLLIQSGSTLHLTVAHLNQIITMHGFKKLHRVHKNIMSQAVSKLDLMEPSRSTLQDYISPPAFTDESLVTADMDALGWTECHVTKVVTLSSFDQNDVVGCSNNDNCVPVSLEKSLVKAPPKKLVLRRKRRAATSQMSGDDDDDYMPAKKWKSLNSVFG